MKNIQTEVDETQVISSEAVTKLSSLVEQFGILGESFRELGASMMEMATGSSQIQQGLASMVQGNRMVEDSVADLKRIIDEVNAFYADLRLLSEENLRED